MIPHYYVLIDGKYLYGQAEYPRRRYSIPYAFETGIAAHRAVDDQYGVSAFRKFAKIIKTDNPGQYNDGRDEKIIIKGGNV